MYSKVCKSVQKGAKICQNIKSVKKKYYKVVKGVGGGGEVSKIMQIHAKRYNSCKI